MRLSEGAYSEVAELAKVLAVSGAGTLPHLMSIFSKKSFALLRSRIQGSFILAFR